jgi:hypothetical protein
VDARRANVRRSHHAVLLFAAQIARTVWKFDNPLYEDEFNVHNFLEHPDVLIGQALTLRYKPVNLDVLPLYTSLIAASPLILWCLMRRPNLTLAGSAILYVLARWFDWNLASSGDNLVLQSVRLAVDIRIRSMVRRRRRRQAQVHHPVARALALAIAWILFAFLIVMTWHVAFLESLVPKWMIKAIYPIDKIDLDMLRFTHFLAVALVVTRYLPRHWAPLTSLSEPPGFSHGEVQISELPRGIGCALHLGVLAAAVAPTVARFLQYPHDRSVAGGRRPLLR